MKPSQAAYSKIGIIQVLHVAMNWGAGRRNVFRATAKKKF